MIFVAVLSVAGGSTHLFGTQPFATKATDTPASKPVRARLAQPGNFARSISDRKTLVGVAQSQTGVATLANQDGALDWLIEEAAVGGTYTLYACESIPAAFPGDWTLVFTALFDSVQNDGGNATLRVQMREYLTILQRPMCRPFLGGGGLDGDASMVGKAKPVVFGAVWNVEPVRIGERLYMVSSRGSVSAQYAKDNGSIIARQITSGDDGVATTADLDAYASFSAISSATIPIGHYATRASDGVLKLGSEPVGTLTCDAMEFDGPSVSPAYGAGDRWAAGMTGDIENAARTHWRIVATMGGECGASFSGADLTYWTTYGSDTDQYGFYAVDFRTTYLDGISAIAISAGCWVGFDRTATLRLRRLTDPATDPADPVLELSATNVLLNGVTLLPNDDAGGVPTRSITVRYPRNWTPQSQWAGIVPDQARREGSKEWPYSGGVDAAVSPGDTANNAQLTLDYYGWAYRESSDGALQYQAPFALTTQLAALVGVYRQWVEVRLPCDLATIEDVELGDIVTLTWPRFGLDAGKRFAVVGIRYELSGDPWIALTLWG